MIELQSVWLFGRVGEDSTGKKSKNHVLFKNRGGAITRSLSKIWGERCMCRKSNKNNVMVTRCPNFRVSHTVKIYQITRSPKGMIPLKVIYQKLQTMHFT